MIDIYFAVLEFTTGTFLGQMHLLLVQISWRNLV